MSIRLWIHHKLQGCAYLDNALDLLPGSPCSNKRSHPKCKVGLCRDVACALHGCEEIHITTRHVAVNKCVRCIACSSCIFLHVSQATYSGIHVTPSALAKRRRFGRIALELGMTQIPLMARPPKTNGVGPSVTSGINNLHNIVHNWEARLHARARI